MRFSLAEILSIARPDGFDEGTVDKVLHLAHLLNVLNSHPSLRGKWVLKGDTTLNLFVLSLPRLSVDIDLNYIGALGREDMLLDRPRIEEAAQAVFSRQGFAVRRVPAGLGMGPTIQGRNGPTRRCQGGRARQPHPAGGGRDLLPTATVASATSGPSERESEVVEAIPLSGTSLKQKGRSRCTGRPHSNHAWPTCAYPARKRAWSALIRGPDCSRASLGLR